jgi:excisionase family DNA binding protein
VADSGDFMTKASNTDKEFLTPGEVARLLHVSPKTVNRWAHEGRLPCIVTLGGHRRFPRVDVEAAVQRMHDDAGRS